MTRTPSESTKAQGEDTKDSSANSPKDFTTAIPMVDLNEAVKIVTAIYEKGLEAESMDTVAKKLDYAAATSSPFYYRIRAARLFGLLGSKSALSERAKDYIKPHEEGMQANVLADAIMGIPDYAELVKKYYGKVLNVELLGHWIARERNLTDACALTCAKVFEASLRFAGMLSEDGSVGSVRTKPPARDETAAAPPPPVDSQSLPDQRQQNSGEGTGKTPPPIYYTLPLDNAGKRIVRVSAPALITKAELKRIQDWLTFQLYVGDETEGVPHE